MNDSNLQRLAAGLHALDCTRCHRGAYCGGINDDGLGRAELLMDDVVADLLAEHTQALSDEVANTCEITRLAEESEKGWRREAEELAVERNRLRAGIEALASNADGGEGIVIWPGRREYHLVETGLLRALLGGGAS